MLTDGDLQPDTSQQLPQEIPAQAVLPLCVRAPELTRATKALRRREVQSCCGIIYAPAFLFIPIVLAAGPVKGNKMPFKSKKKLKMKKCDQTSQA